MRTTHREGGGSVAGSDGEVPRVTIAFPTYCRPEAAVETLHRLRDGVACPYEVRIYDNSPTPGDWDLRAGEFCTFLGRNEGTAARNRAAFEARAPYVLMLDDDSHPLPGSVCAGIRALEAMPASVVGLIAEIRRPDGTREASLLPTVMQGCGALFRTDALRRIGGGYPDDFVFYGEEYWLTLALYAAGGRLRLAPDLRVEHRVDGRRRDLARIFHFLARNNDIVWERFAPVVHRDRVVADTRTRIRCIAAKEGVEEAARQGFAERLRWEGEPTPLADGDFEAFSLLTRFRDCLGRLRQAAHVVLCGCGKFPGLWAQWLTEAGVAQVFVFDRNPGMHGAVFGRWPVLAPEALPGADGRTVYVVGHSSHVDTEQWLEDLAARGVPSSAVCRLAERSVAGDVG